MKEDIWRFTGIIVFSLVAGGLTGQMAICLLGGLVLLIFWQYRVMYQLLHWLQRRKEYDPPEFPGMIDEICREIDFLRARYKNRKNKLARILKRFQEATAALPDAVVLLGENEVIEWSNDKANKYLGIRWPQDSGQRLTNLVRHPKLVSFLNNKEENYLDQVLQLDAPKNAELKLELRITPYGGKQKLLVARDVTSIQLANQMRKDFIANASHELRSPLTVISGYLEGIQDDIENSIPARKSQIRQMRKQADRMQRLIDDLLQLSSLETSTENDKGEVVVVPELLANIYQEAQSLSGEMKHIFYMETDTKLWVHGKQRELYSAFSNVIFNAVQHSPKRSIIRIRWFADNDGAHMEVTDNGYGIATEHIPRLTERFYRIDKGRSRDRGGTGLAIVKYALVLHGGKLHIESQEGVGSCFRCDLPPGIIVNRSGNEQESLTA